jgi:hypothetical protein
MRAATALLVAFLTAGSAFGQSGLRLPNQGEPGLDPTFARGWFAPDYDRFGFALYNWREAVGFAPGQRMQWSYATDRGSLAMSMGSGAYVEEQRQFSLYGSYWLNPDWALSAETQTQTRDPLGLFRLQDIRIGVQRRF